MNKIEETIMLIGPKWGETTPGEIIGRLKDAGFQIVPLNPTPKIVSSFYRVFDSFPIYARRQMTDTMAEEMYLDALKASREEA